MKIKKITIVFVSDLGTMTFLPVGQGIVKQHAPHKGRIILGGHRRVEIDGVFTLIRSIGVGCPRG
jgi:hypothetical protein